MANAKSGPNKKKFLDLMDQYRCPRGPNGKYVAKLMNKGHDALTLWGLSKVKIAVNSIILDVGCGGGKTINRLAKLAPLGKVFGIDISSEMTKYSTKLNQKNIAKDQVQILLTSVENTSFPDNYFDLITAFETYYFWSNFREALKELKRVLKSGGKLLLVNEMIQDGVYEVENAKLIKETKVRLVALQEIRNTMLSVGFAGVQVLLGKNGSPWNVVIAKK